jgi:AcrR family transcriptional regulator
MSRQGTYHHGDLKNALLDAATDLVRERGARGFSVSEAARRAGVSSSAPYRHFTDRDAMLAVLALRSFTELEARFASLVLEETLAARAVQIALAYVAFAREDPARFEVMFASGIDKNSYTELLDQTCRVQAQLEEALAPYLPPDRVVDRSAELWSVAHGIAALAVGGSLQHVVDPARIDTIAASAARTWATGATTTTNR